MDFAVPQPRLEFEQLQRAYQNAWRLFCAEVHAWQSLSLDAANVTAMEAAKDGVGRAERSYREQRNKLADYMIAKSASRRNARAESPSGRIENRTRVTDEDAHQATARRSRVERLAYQLWEDGGKRGGRADADWYWAEGLVYE
jgi:hypothetical protein